MADDEQQPTRVGNVDAGRLRGFVERLENVATEKKAASSDFADVMAEAKSAGFNPAALKRLLKLRKLDTATRDEIAHELEVYCRALGMDPSAASAEVVGGNIGGAPPAITDEQIFKALELRKGGLSYRAIAAETGMSKSSVQRLMVAAADSVSHDVPQPDGTEPGTTILSKLREDLERHIAEKTVSKDVAKIGRDIVRLLELGKLTEAAAIVSVQKAVKTATARKKLDS